MVSPELGTPAIIEHGVPGTPGNVAIQDRARGKVQVGAFFAARAGSGPRAGRAVFNRACLSCHRMFGAGGDVGPELTGSDRANPDYILENVLDPSAAVNRDYTMSNVATTDGRLLSGIIRDQTPTSWSSKRRTTGLSWRGTTSRRSDPPRPQ